MFPLVHFIKRMANTQHIWQNIVAMARDRKGNSRGQLTVGNVGTGVMAVVSRQRTNDQDNQLS